VIADERALRQIHAELIGNTIPLAIRRPGHGLHALSDFGEVV